MDRPIHSILIIAATGFVLIAGCATVAPPTVGAAPDTPAEASIVAPPDEPLDRPVPVHSPLTSLQDDLPGPEILETGDLTGIALPEPVLTERPMKPRRPVRQTILAGRVIHEPIPTAGNALAGADTAGGTRHGVRTALSESGRSSIAEDSTPGYHEDSPPGYREESTRVPDRVIPSVRDTPSVLRTPPDPAGAAATITRTNRPSTADPEAPLVDRTPLADVAPLLRDAAASFSTREREPVNPRTTIGEDEVVVTLPGSGWIYVGREYGTGTAEFLRKLGSTGNDRFVFHFTRDGGYGLWFQREDPVTGLITNERREVQAGSPEIDPAPTPFREASMPDSVAAALPVTSAVALAGNPTDNPTIATLAEQAARLGDLRSAAELWLQISDEGGEHGANAREQFFLAARELADPSLLDRAISLSEGAGELVTEDLVAAARAVESAGLPSRAAIYYQRAIDLGGATDGLDALYYALARSLERPGPGRDVRRATEIYRLLVAEYPLSAYWEASEARIAYLRRHYFDVR